MCLSNPILKTDQIGQPRVGPCDIGAIEFGANGSSVVSVAVDVKPGDSQNNIQPNSNGRISVAILSTASFDASTIDETSLKFGPEQIPPDRGGHLRDVNGDGLLDLVLQFRVRESGIQCGDSRVSITGETAGDIRFGGSDSVTTVGCKGNNGKKNQLN